MAATYIESDLNIAAFLLARNIKFIGMELVGTRYAFQFADPDSATTAALEYSRGAPIPAREFAAAQQRLKTALYTAKAQENRKERNYGNSDQHNRR